MQHADVLNQKYESCLPDSLLLLEGEILFWSNMKMYIPVIQMSLHQGSVSVEPGLVVLVVS